MCYDVSFKSTLKEFSYYFPDLVWDEQLEINFEAAAHIIGHGYKEHPIIYRTQQHDTFHCRLMEWGIIPFYIKDEKTFIRQRATMLNARSERILDDPKSYWFKIKNRRCLIPVTGMFEHHHEVNGKRKIPYYINLKTQPLFFVPGLYSVAELPDLKTGELVKRYTYTMVTREANALMKVIHNGGDNAGRMPLFLPIELSKCWVKESLSIDEYREILNYEMASDALEYRSVWTLRGKKTLERPEDLSPTDEYKWADLPELTV